MGNGLRMGLFTVGAFFAVLGTACFGDSHRDGGGGVVSTGGPVGQDDAGSTPVPIGDGGPSLQPLLVDVDPNQTLTAAPGEGAGVFIEYKTGGHWHVWWTCDTNKTQLSCAYDVTVTVASGSISNGTSDATSTAITAAPSSLEATSTTTTSLDGVRFDTAPGAMITVDAAIGGLRDGSFLFFVQNGQINGGYTGKLTDPLKLEPSSP
jgi:hypothetical protein